MEKSIWMNPPARHALRGITLMDALIALLVLCLGLLGAVKTQAWLRSNADAARQRTEAVALAQAEMERLRSAFDATKKAAPDLPPGFSLAHTVSAAQGALQARTVAVQWADRSGSPHTVQLHTGTTNLSPVYSAALALPSQDRVLGVRRHLPWQARTTADGRSFFKPGSGDVAWRLDIATGRVDAICRSGTCHAVTGALLAGYVRFSLGPRPDPLRPNDHLLDLRIDVRLEGASVETVSCRTQASSASQDEGVAYACLIPLDRSQDKWSGQLVVVPLGWSIDATPSGRKICRYNTDLDGSGRIDRNEEHPARYREVHGPLLHQNYLVISGDADCPAGDPPHNGGLASTALHQP